jgi:flagellar motor switch protein FliM
MIREVRCVADVLSQNEIDALLKQLSSGELDANDFEDNKSAKVKEYDFSRPAKFSKEHLRTLEIIFEHYGRLLSSNLPAYLRKNVQIEVMNSEAVTYSEFANALSNPVLLGVVNMHPLQGNIVIELATNIGYAMIDRLLGGLGEPLEKVREFSEIELSILERIFNIIIDLLREPWENVVEITPYLERIETNSQFAQIISPSEMIAIVTINVNIGGIEGLMNVCLPYMTLEDVMDKLNTKYWFSTMQDRDEASYSDVIETAITKALVPISAELGQSTITVMDFINLQVGDIIRLNRGIEDELDVYVGNIVKFKALPGSASNSYAVKVTEIYREEE